MFLNPMAQEIADLLRAVRTIAVVGLSPDRTRPITAWRRPCSVSGIGLSR
jgi:predicted CoA-binding protein